MEHGKLWNHDYKLAQTGLGAQNHSKQMDTKEKNGGTGIILL